LEQEFFQGEIVICHLDGKESFVYIQDKVTLPVGGADNAPAGNTIPATGKSFTRYHLALLKVTDLTHNGSYGHVPPGDLRRSKDEFNKRTLKAFLKQSLTRQTWLGAPWQVKPNLCERYGLPKDIPKEILAFFRKAARKTEGGFTAADEAGQFVEWLFSGVQAMTIRPPPPKQPPVTQPPMQLPAPQQSGPPGVLLQNGHLPPGYPQPNTGLPGTPYLENNATSQWLASQTGLPPADYPVPQRSNSNHQGSRRAKSPPKAAPVRQPPRPPSPPRIVYPVEDLDLPPMQGATCRPKLKKFSAKYPNIKDDALDSLLHTWAAMNMLHEWLVIDTFTIDDFAEAMGLGASYEGEIGPEMNELVVETHCAVLKRIVDAAGQNLTRGIWPTNKQQQQQEEDSEEEDSESEADSPETEPEQRPPARSTRSSYAKAEAEAALKQAQQSPPPKYTNKSKELLAEFNWLNELKMRKFNDGGWQMIMVALISAINQYVRTYKDKAQRALAFLVPSDMEPTVETVMNQYAVMDINLRVECLMMILYMAMSTKELKIFLEQSHEEQTQVRRDIKLKRDERRQKYIFLHALSREFVFYD
jgi:hypothetical protein